MPKSHNIRPVALGCFIQVPSCTKMLTGKVLSGWSDLMLLIANLFGLCCFYACNAFFSVFENLLKVHVILRPLSKQSFDLERSVPVGGCSTVVLRMPHVQETVGLNPTVFLNVHFSLFSLFSSKCRYPGPQGGEYLLAM